MSYNPISQNYDAVRANTGVSRRNANEYVYDPYPRACAWKIIRRCLWAVLILGFILVMSFVYIEESDARSMNTAPAMKLTMSTTLSDH